MKKRLAIIAVTAVTALTAIGSASAAMWDRNYGSNGNAPAGSNCAADTACKMPSTANAGPLVSSPNSNTSSQSHGTGYHVK